MQRLKKGDQVIVTAGRSKGQTGAVLQLLDGDRLIVEGANLVKKHTKGNPQAGVTGGIISQEATIHASNVMLLNPETQKGERVGFRDEDGKKVRFFKSTNTVVDA